jgi:hypothetical protein
MQWDIEAIGDLGRGYAGAYEPMDARIRARLARSAVPRLR